MSKLPKLTESVDIIQGLTDRPNALDGLDPAQLKAKFDEAANIIKLYINNVLIPEIESIDAGIVTKSDLTNARKLSPSGNFTGSWFGIDNPVLADPGIANVVVQHTAQLANIEQEVESLQQPTIAKISQDMAEGVTIMIDCYGDSLYYGWASGGSGQVSVPPPLMLQTVLRTYFGNNSIIVNNHGVSGNQTTNALRTFDSNMQSSSAQVVYICYGLNDLSGANPSGASDPAITVEQYRQNLRSMVLIARKHGKIVVLETPNVELANHSASNYQLRMEGSQQFSNAMSQVAAELNVPLIDHLHLTKKYLASRPKVTDALPDGIHPSDTLYKQKGVNMALPFLNLFKIFGQTIIPASSPGFRGTSPARDTSFNMGSRTGLFFYSDYSVRTFVWIDSPGLDVYLATAQWQGGSSSCQVKVDGNVVGTFNMVDSSFTTVYGADNEILVIEDAAPGLHLIEVYNDSGIGRVGMYYLRTHNTRKKRHEFFPSNSNIPSIIDRTTVLQNADVTISASGVLGRIMTDIPTSRVIKPIDIEVEASFIKGDGFSLFMKPNSNGSGPQGGIFFWLHTSTGIINIAEGQGPTSFTTTTTLGSSDYSLNSHIYRVTIDQAGLATIYVDDSILGTYTMTKPHVGGYFGFFKNASGTSRIKRVSLI